MDANRYPHLLESGNLAKDPLLQCRVRLVRPPLKSFPRPALLQGERVIIDADSALRSLADSVVVEADDDLAPLAHAQDGHTNESRVQRAHA